MQFAKCAAIILVLAVGGLARSTDGVAQVVGSPCLRGSPKCPAAIRIRAGGPTIVVGERLSPKQTSFSYQFAGEPGQTLRWNFKGRPPAVRVLLTKPSGDTDGPGLPATVAIDQKGLYVFSVSSNKMAEKIYGRFRLSFRLIKMM
jgi:hypothetical protein